MYFQGRVICYNNTAPFVGTGYILIRLLKKRNVATNYFYSGGVVQQPDSVVAKLATDKGFVAAPRLLLKKKHAQVHIS
jgi:hypothetical protein